MVRRMKVISTQIESVVTLSGNSGHIVVPKVWIGREAIVALKEKESKTKGKSDFIKVSSILIRTRLNLSTIIYTMYIHQK